MDSVYRLFAALLEYPTADLEQQARDCCDMLLAAGSPAAAPLLRFWRYVQEASPERMEELYTRTFDLQVICSPYVGYQLFGESYKRGTFMARLNGGYRARGYSAGNELPDHVAVVLRYLALGAADEFSRALLAEGLQPALAKMAQTLCSPSDNPYSEVIGALSLLLGDGDKMGVADA